MRLTGFLSSEEVGAIHRNALRVLAETGVLVEHEAMLGRLEALGGQVDHATSRVRFAPNLVERYLFGRPREEPQASIPKVTLFSSVYQSYYLDPASGELLPFDEDLLGFYFALARSLPGMGWLGVLGVPFRVEGVPDACGPLLEKVVAWKNGVEPCGTVQSTQMCEPLLELFACHAAFSGKPIGELFLARGYMISPLRVARLECEQLLFFAERGLRMTLGHQPSQGLTAPGTFAGAVTLALAEQIFLFLLDRALHEKAALELTATVMTMDPRTAMALYGRPEQQRINAAFGDLGRFYGCPCRGHTGLSDAKAPSFEAGAQKATGALITALALGEGSIEAGLLGVDEICSPLQMVLDVELAASLNALFAQPAIDDEACGAEEVAAIVGRGGNFLDSDLTACRCRTEFFLPKTWSTQLVSGWNSSGRKRDVDLAREWVAAFRSNYAPVGHIPPDEERELLAIVHRAAGRLDTAA